MIDLELLADTMQEWSSTSGDHHMQAAHAIRQLIKLQAAQAQAGSITKNQISEGIFGWGLRNDDGHNLSMDDSDEIAEYIMKQAAQAQAGTKARRSAVNPEAGDYANCVDDIPQAQAGDGVNQQLLEEGRFKQGAEGFRKELLTATTPFLWPIIEGVFAVFAHAHGFEPESNVGDQVRKKKAAIAAAQEGK